MKHRDYTDYLRDILDSIRDAIEFTETMSFDEFLTDRKTSNAVIRSLEVIGEATRKIPEDIMGRYPEIPWKRMTQMRNKLIHEYFGIDLEIVWTVIKEELPQPDSWGYKKNTVCPGSKDCKGTGTMFHRGGGPGPV